METSLLKTGTGTLEVRGRYDNYNGSFIISQGTVLFSGNGFLDFNVQGQNILNDSGTGSNNTALLYDLTGLGADQNISKLIVVENNGTGTTTVGTTAGVQNLIFTGGLIVNKDVTLQVGHTAEATIFVGGIMGPGNLTIQTPGDAGTRRMTFQASSNASAYSNALSVNSTGTTARIDRYQYGNVTLIDPGTGNSLFLRLNDIGMIAPNSSVTLGNRTTLELGADSAINALNGVVGSSVTVAGGDDQVVVLTIGASNGSGDHQGTIINARSFGLLKAGNGTQTFGGANTYNGGTDINGGTLLINNTTGSGTGTGYVNIHSGGTLGGTGIIAPTAWVTVNSLAGTDSTDAGVYINAGGTLAPGTTTAGRLTIATGGTAVVAFQTGSNFNAQLVSPITAGTTYDQLDLTGVAANSLLSLNNATLNALFDPTYAPAIGDKFYIMTQTGTGIVNGTFNGIAQDGVVVSNVNGSGFDAFVSYTGDLGTTAIIGGNDVVIFIAAPVPEPGQIVALCALMLGLGCFFRQSLKRKRRIFISSAA